MLESFRCFEFGRNIKSKNKEKWEFRENFKKSTECEKITEDNSYRYFILAFPDNICWCFSVFTELHLFPYLHFEKCFSRNAIFICISNLHNAYIYYIKDLYLLFTRDYFIFNKECYENLTNKMRSRETFRNCKITSLMNSVII